MRGLVVVEQALGRRTRSAAECFADNDVMPRVKNSVSAKSFMPYNRKLGRVLLRREYVDTAKLCSVLGAWLLGC